MMKGGWMPSDGLKVGNFRLGKWNPHEKRAGFTEYSWRIITTWLKQRTFFPEYRRQHADRVSRSQVGVGWDLGRWMHFLNSAVIRG